MARVGEFDGDCVSESPDRRALDWTNYRQTLGDANYWQTLNWTNYRQTLGDANHRRAG
ncbi:hypothetical protein [Halorussus salinus]|uniref:hypothetical protein n=1 Tax=Halorussus salinus TaxID=1364935 RepID=UPI00138F33F9|nr:hypothetical protein [Halorussus salinus]